MAENQPTSTPTGDADTTSAADVRDAFVALKQVADRAIPVVGLGLLVPAGGVTAHEMVEALKSAFGCDLPADLFLAAEALESAHGHSTVQEAVASAVRERSTTVTPQLRCLAQVPSRTIVTLNYDDAIESAIEVVGGTPKTYLVAEANDFMRGDRDPRAVHVMHLHGHYSEPASIVLSQATYDAAARDERLSMLVRWLATTHPLVIVGTSYSQREVTLRDNLLWAVGAWPTDSLEQHLYVGVAGSVTEDVRVTGERGGVRFLELPIGDYSEYEYVSRAISVLSPSGFELRHRTPELPRTNHYLELTLATDDEAPPLSGESIGFWRASRRLRHVEDLTPEALRTSGRALLQGPAGSGKTQTLMHTFDQPADFVVRLPQLRIDRNTTASWLLEDIVTRAGKSADVLRQVTCTFVFDAFDEMTVDARARLVQLLEANEGVLVDHQLIVASRPHTDVSQLLNAGFKRYLIIPDPEWLEKYALQRGLAPEALNRYFLLSGLRDLAATACFGGAIVDGLLDGAADMPTDALGVLLYAQDRVTETDDTTHVPAGVRRQVLDYLAFALEARGIVDAPRSEFSSALSSLELLDVDQVGPCLDTFVARSLLLADDNTLRFPTAHAQEARAARVIRSHKQGLELLREIGLRHINEYPGVRPVIRRAVQFCLEGSPAAWRDEVAHFDQRAALRATPAEATPERRIQAIWDLWRWYEDRLVWFPTDGRLFVDLMLDDEYALQRLADDSSPPGDLVAHLLKRAQGGEHRTLRGNALRFLAYLDPGLPLKAAANGLLSDSDPTVRRIAASALREVPDPESSIDALAAAYVTEPDELARESMVATMVHVLGSSDADRLIRLVCPAGHVLERRALRLLVGQLSVDTQLRWIAGLDRAADGGVDAWIDELLETRSDDLAEQDYATLLPLMGRRDMIHHTRELRALASKYPAATLQYARQVEPFELYTVLSLLGRVPKDQLREIAVRQGALELIEGIEPRHQLRAETRTPAPTLRDFVRLDEIGAVLRARPDPEEVAALDPQDGERLDQMVAAAITVHTKSSNLDEQFEWDDATEHTSNGPGPLVAWSAATNQPLGPELWVGLLRKTHCIGPEGEWLARRYTPEVRAALEAALPTLTTPALERLARMLPPDHWTAPLAADVAERLFNDPGSDRYMQRRITGVLADLKLPEVLQGLADSHGEEEFMIYEALVRAGDSAAEERCLQRALSDLDYAFGDDCRADPWLNSVTHKSSGPALMDLAEALYRSNDDRHNTAHLWHAWINVFGEGAMAAVDAVADRLPPSLGSSLWYRRDEMLGRLIETACIERVGPTLADAVRLARALYV